MNNEDTTPQADRDLLVSLGKRVYEKQLERDWTNTRMVTAYPGLGSTKTYQLIREGKLNGLEIERWLIGYRSVSLQLEIEDGAEMRSEPVFEDLGPVMEMQRLFIDLSHTGTNRRIAIFSGESGTGKSKAIEALVKRLPHRCIKIEADESWAKSPVEMLGAILSQLGRPEGVARVAQRLRACKAAMGQTRTCVLMDEAHHMGTGCLNVIKTLVNTTPGEFILCGIPDIWRILESTHHLEMRQLITNRFSERVNCYLSRPDIETFMRNALKSCDIDRTTLKDGAERMYAQAHKRGNFCFVAAVCESLQKSWRDEKITLEYIIQAIGQETSKRRGRQETT